MVTCGGSKNDGLGLTRNDQLRKTGLPVPGYNNYQGLMRTDFHGGGPMGGREHVTLGTESIPDGSSK